MTPALNSEVAFRCMCSSSVLICVVMWHNDVSAVCIEVAQAKVADSRADGDFVHVRVDGSRDDANGCSAKSHPHATAKTCYALHNIPQQYKVLTWVAVANVRGSESACDQAHEENG